MTVTAQVRGAEPGARTLGAGPQRALWRMAAVVLALHVLGFALLAAWARDQSHPATTTIGLGTGLLAYALGLRHAFDIDHVAAIDNTTRSLMARGERPVATGFFFSLGHSSVVFVMSVLLCLGLKTFYAQVGDAGSSFHHWTRLVGTSVSGLFLLLIGALNVVVLANVGRIFRSMRAGEYDELELERHLAHRGFLNRLLGGLVRRVDASWKLYPLGVLFGLGFDTATEISLLVLAGSTVGAGLPLWAVLSLPLLFAAGMSLLDTLDGALMVAAYGWAFTRPVRKVYYNLTVTGLSVAVALSVGGLEIAQVVSGALGLRGGLWDFANGLDLNTAGFVLVGVFLVVWLLAMVVWRAGRFEERWANGR